MIPNTSQKAAKELPNILSGVSQKVRLLTMDFSKYMRDAMTVVKTVYVLRWVR